MSCGGVFLRSRWIATPLDGYTFRRAEVGGGLRRGNWDGTDIGTVAVRGRELRLIGLCLSCLIESSSGITMSTSNNSEAYSGHDYSLSCASPKETAVCHVQWKVGHRSVPLMSHPENQPHRISMTVNQVKQLRKWKH